VALKTTLPLSKQHFDLWTLPFFHSSRRSELLIFNAIFLMALSGRLCPFSTWKLDGFESDW